MNHNIKNTLNAILCIVLILLNNNNASSIEVNSELINLYSESVKIAKSQNIIIAEKENQLKQIQSINTDSNNNVIEQQILIVKSPAELIIYRNYLDIRTLDSVSYSYFIETQKKSNYDEYTLDYQIDNKFLVEGYFVKGEKGYSYDKKSQKFNEMIVVKKFSASKINIKDLFYHENNRVILYKQILLNDLIRAANNSEAQRKITIELNRISEFNSRQTFYPSIEMQDPLTYDFFCEKKGIITNAIVKDKVGNLKCYIVNRFTNKISASIDTADIGLKIPNSLNGFTLKRINSIGIFFSEVGDQKIVSRVLPNSPAKIAGIEKGDVLKSIKKLSNKLINSLDGCTNSYSYDLIISLPDGSPDVSITLDSVPIVMKIPIDENLIGKYLKNML